MKLNKGNVMKVLLEEGVWLGGWPKVYTSDPPRTLKEKNAYEFDNMDQARKALEGARVYRPFKSAVICEDFV